MMPAMGPKGSGRWRMGDGRVDLASLDLIIGSYIYKEEAKGHAWFIFIFALLFLCQLHH